MQAVVNTAKALREESERYYQESLRLRKLGLDEGAVRLEDLSDELLTLAGEYEGE